MVKFKLIKRNDIKVGVMTNNKKSMQKGNKNKTLRFCDTDITAFNKTRHIR
ncbi:MAG: hypothetical protein IKJ43_00370 [Bacilli bacterium]|nr:hypothetical protein [Bacilli bacterium]